MWGPHVIGPGDLAVQKHSTEPKCISFLYHCQTQFSIQFIFGTVAGVVERSVTPACLYVRAASCSPFHAFSLQAERCANRAANPQVFASLGNIIWLRCLPIHCISKFFDGGRCENHQKAKKDEATNCLFLLTYAGIIWPRPKVIWCWRQAESPTWMC